MLHFNLSKFWIIETPNGIGVYIFGCRTGDKAQILVVTKGHLMQKFAKFEGQLIREQSKGQAKHTFNHMHICIIFIYFFSFFLFNTAVKIFLVLINSTLVFLLDARHLQI